MADGRAGPADQGLVADLESAAASAARISSRVRTGSTRVTVPPRRRRWPPRSCGSSERWNCPAPRCGGQRGGRPVEDERRRAGGRRPAPAARRTSTSVSAKPPRPVPERLHHRLLGGEARRQGLGRIGGAAGVRLFGVGEEAGGEPGAAGQDPPEAGHVDRIHPDADDRMRATVGAARHAARRRPSSARRASVVASAPPVDGAGRSFDGHRLGQVAGTVDVVAVQAGQAVGQLLQGDDADHRARAAARRAAPTGRGRPRPPPPRRRRRPPAPPWRRGCAPRRCWRAASPTAGCGWRCRPRPCPARSGRWDRA